MPSEARPEGHARRVPAIRGVLHHPGAPAPVRGAHQARGDVRESIVPPQPWYVGNREGGAGRRCEDCVKPPIAYPADHGLCHVGAGQVVVGSADRDVHRRDLRSQLPQLQRQRRLRSCVAREHDEYARAGAVCRGRSLRPLRSACPERSARSVRPTCAVRSMHSARLIRFLRALCSVDP
eukprot:6214419-Pleurochrysis_carterae.AAC.1